MTSRLRADAARVFSAAVDAAKPSAATVRRSLAAVPFWMDHNGGDVLVVGAGKAVVALAQATVAVLRSLESPPTRIYGHCVTKDGHTDGVTVVPDTDVTVGEAGHPVPDPRGAAQARRVLELVRDAPPGTLVFALFTGGGSSLMTMPAPGVEFSDFQAVTDQLLRCGASIDELNAVRKHLSGVSGGRLAAAGAHTRMVTLLISDVIGDPVDVIASGPTTADPSTLDDCRAIVDKYELGAGLPPTVKAAFDASDASVAVPESPKPGAPELAHNVTHIVASNRQSVEAAAEAAAAAGYAPVILTSRLHGEAREVASVVASLALDAAATTTPPRSPYDVVQSLPAAIIMGGETTVTVRGSGVGGRNQELALAAGIELADVPNVVVLACGTDGTDGPTDATGAIVDGGMVAAAAAAGLDAQAALADNDAYTFFTALDGSDAGTAVGSHLVKPGPTGTNVMDLTVVLVGKSSDEDGGLRK